MPRFLIFVVAVAFFSACAGAAGTNWRIRENKEKFYTYPAEVQAKIRDREIAVGFTEDMVLIALGKPDRTYMRNTEQGKLEVWAYTIKKPRLGWGYESGTRQRTVYGSDLRLGAGGGARDHKDEKIRALFREGLVVIVEEGVPE